MKKILCFGLLASTLTASAQPKTNDDGTVTFRYQNDTAKTVLVDVQFAGRKEMTRGADGNINGFRAYFRLHDPSCIPIATSLTV